LGYAEDCILVPFAAGVSNVRLITWRPKMKLKQVLGGINGSEQNQEK
jgi:hypothetical protein